MNNAIENGESMKAHAPASSGNSHIVDGNRSSICNEHKHFYYVFHYWVRSSASGRHQWSQWATRRYGIWLCSPCLWWQKFRTAPLDYAYLQREGSRHVSWSNGAGRCTNINSKKLNSNDHRRFEYARIASSSEMLSSFFFSFSLFFSSSHHEFKFVFFRKYKTRS